MLVAVVDKSQSACSALLVCRAAVVDDVCAVAIAVADFESWPFRWDMRINSQLVALFVQT